MTQLMQDILKLSIAERILMVEAIWDSIPQQNDSIEISAETKKLLDERIEAHRLNKNEGSSWSDVKNRIKKQL